MRDPKCVLIVDDEEDIREVAALSFELAGWEVRTASSGRDGIAAVQIRRPDIILLDVMMPELDGPGTLALLQEGEPSRHIPVVFLTAKIQNADRRRYEQLGGVRGVIAKPFDPLTLPTAIEELLEKNGVSTEVAD